MFDSATIPPEILWNIFGYLVPVLAPFNADGWMDDGLDRIRRVNRHWKWVADGMKWGSVHLRILPGVFAAMDPAALDHFLASKCKESSSLILQKVWVECLAYHWNFLGQTARVKQFTDLTIRGCKDIRFHDNDFFWDSTIIPPIPPSPTLCQLDQISDMKNLVSLCIVDSDVDFPGAFPAINFPSLQTLHLEGRHLPYISSITAPQLEKLTLVGRVAYADVLKLLVQSGCHLRSLILGTRGFRSPSMPNLLSVMNCIEALHGLEYLTILHPLVRRCTVEDLVGKLPSLRVLTISLTQPDPYNFTTAIMQEIERCIRRDPARYCALETIKIVANAHHYNDAVMIFEDWNMVDVVRRPQNGLGFEQYPFLSRCAVNVTSFYSDGMDVL